MENCASFLGDSSSTAQNNCSVPNSDNSALQETLSIEAERCDRPNTIVPDHWEEWVVGSGVSPAIVAANVTSLRTPKEFKNATNRHSLTNMEIADYLPAWQVESKGYPAGYQIKPAIPWQGDAKYITPRKHKAHPIFLKAPGIDWEQIKSDRSIPIFITEGTKKAGCGLTHELATISISGVWNGQIKGRLTDLIEQFVRNGRRVYLAFDSDVMEKTQVQKALKQLGALILDAGGIPYVIQIPDLSEDGKMGMDDFIVSEGIDDFKSLIREAPTLQEWRDSLAPEEKHTTPRRPEPQDMAVELAEDFRDRFRYDNTRATWTMWDGRRWKRITETEMLQQIHRELLRRKIRFKTFSYIKDVFTQLKLVLCEAEWKQLDRERFINFANGVLDLKSGKLRPQNPGDMFTSYIDRDYEPLALSGDFIQDLRQHAPCFWKYASFAMSGDERKIQKMVAAIAAVLRWKFSKLQMFLQLVGEPAAGKGVFARLLQEMVGKERYGASALNKLCGGREDYAAASIIDKQLVICSDERKLKPGTENTILKLTGSDLIPFRHPAQPYRYAPFHGTLVVISNFPIFSGDLSGIDRRSCLIHFPNPVPKARRNYRFEEVLHRDINALTNIALAMSDGQVEALLRGTGSSHISDFRAQEWCDKCENDSVAAWMDAIVREAPSDRVSIKSLHESYLQWCSANGERYPVSNRYIKRRIFAHARWLEWQVRDGRTSVERHVRGLKLDPQMPSIEETLQPMTFGEKTPSENDLREDSFELQSTNGKGQRAKNSSLSLAEQLALQPLQEKGCDNRSSHISKAPKNPIEKGLSAEELTFPVVWNNPEFFRNFPYSDDDRTALSKIETEIEASGKKGLNAEETTSPPPASDMLESSQNGNTSARDHKVPKNAEGSNLKEQNGLKGLDISPNFMPSQVENSPSSFAPSNNCSETRASSPRLPHLQSLEKEACDCHSNGYCNDNSSSASSASPFPSPSKGRLERNVGECIEGGDRSSNPPEESVPPMETRDRPTETRPPDAELSSIPQEFRSIVTKIERLAGNPQKALEEWGRTSFLLLSHPDTLQQIWQTISPSTQRAIQHAADCQT